MKPITRAVCVGGGVIGAGWAARLILNGIDVTVCDPADGTEDRVRTVVANAERATNALIDGAPPNQGSLTFSKDIALAASGAGLIVESVPERIEIKHEVYRAAEACAPDDALIASSTSGIIPSELQKGMTHPERLVVAHPFNPVYLLPCVEIVPGAQTSDETVSRAETFYRGLGMEPIVLRKEIEAFVADRLLEAMWRESLWLIKDGIATTQQIDDVIRTGFGLRFAQMGIFETYRLGGGEAGMRHFLKQFGPALKWPWTKLMDVPDLTDELIERIASQSDSQSGNFAIGDLERIRDDNLVAILQALKAQDWGAGQSISGKEA